MFIFLEAHKITASPQSVGLPQPSHTPTYFQTKLPSWTRRKNSQSMAFSTTQKPFLPCILQLGKEKKKGPGDHTSRWCKWLQSKHQGCWEEPSTTGFSCPKDVGKDWSGQKPNHPQVGGSCVPGTSLHQERSKKATGTKTAEHLFSHYKHCFSIFYKSVVTVLVCSSLDVLDIGLPISKVHLQQCPPAVRSCIPSFS